MRALHFYVNYTSREYRRVYIYTVIREIRNVTNVPFFFIFFLFFFIFVKIPRASVRRRRRRRRREYRRYGNLYANTVQIVPVDVIYGHSAGT